MGKGVTKVDIDDKVILSWIKGKGIEAGGSKYKLGNTYINAGPATIQEYTVVSENPYTINLKSLMIKLL